jgi:queuine/archaeosine tRNA-ribosyltransferase
MAVGGQSFEFSIDRRRCNEKGKNSYFNGGRRLMGNLVYFCSGADNRVVSGKNIKALLLNVPNDARNERVINRSLALIKSSGAQTVMLDSGGYQLLRSQEKGWEIGFDKEAPIYQPDKINLTPWHLVQAAKALNPHIMVALDLPVKKMKEKEEQEKEFQAKLKFNVEWAIETAKLREKYCPGIKLLIPAQVYSLGQLDIFFNKIQAVHFDGVSMPVRNLNLEELSHFLIRFYQMGVKRIHLLGTSSFYRMALCAFMARHYFECVSLDSTTWRIEAQHARYLNPDLSRTWVVDDGIIGDHQKLPCQCPWCMGKTFSDIKALGTRDRLAFLRFHNLWATEKAARNLFENARSPEEMAGYLKKLNTDPKKAEKVYRCLIGLYECQPLTLRGNRPILKERRQFL